MRVRRLGCFLLLGAVACGGKIDGDGINDPSNGMDSSGGGLDAGLIDSGPDAEEGDVFPVDPLQPAGGPGCNLSEAAFCETFDEPHPGGRGGDIDESKWSFARHGHMITAMLKRGPAATRDPGRPAFSNTPTFCGETFTGVLPPNDVRICSGQLNEVFHDFGDFGINSMRVRQPFDFTGRTGTIVFDVDAKLNPGYEGHGWWNEIWITEDAAPVPYHGAPTVGSYPRRGIGFQMVAQQLETCGRPGFNEVGYFFVTDNYEVVRQGNFNGECFRSEDTRLNRFRIQISTSRVEIFASDSDKPTMAPRLVASASGLNLRFSRGYVHFQHSQYNAAKASNNSSSQTYRWDNIGFDGPVYPVPRSYDIVDPLTDYQSEGVVGKSVGYYLSEENRLTPQTFTLSDVDVTDAVYAELNFNLYAAPGQRVRFRWNDGPWHDVTVPANIGRGDGTQVPGHVSTALLRAFTAPIPVTELVQGANKLEVTLAQASDLGTVLGNVDLTVQVAH